MLRGLAFFLALCAAPAAACTVDPASVTDYPASVVTGAGSGPVSRAWYNDATTRYQHYVLGRQHEPATLWVNAMGNAGLCGHMLELDPAHVFEDIAPRLVDLDGDGVNEVITTRSRAGQGAQVAVYRWTGSDLVLDATTPYIGQSRRWLAIIGVADLDGDGALEIAYIDRPHLARTLRVWRYENETLTEVAAAGGLTNHRIGEDFISSGIRDCGAGPEIITANADWSRLIATRLDGQTLSALDLGGWSPSNLTAALACTL